MNFIIVGAISALLGVAFGAFGAHALKSMVSEYHLSIFETGVRYQMYHSFALILIGILNVIPGQPDLKWSGYAFLLGILIFSGSLYALTLTGIKVLGAVTPIGGVAFIAGWALLAYGYFKQ